MNINKGNLSIRNATAKDTELLAAWWNDGAVMAHAGFPNGLGTTPEKIAADLASDSDETTRRHIIELSGKPIGEMNYRNLGDKTAIIGIKICDFAEQNKGYGTIMLTVFIDALFRHMGYETIDIDTNLTNTRAQKVYEQKLGFRKICVNENSWRNQVGELQSQVCYKLSKADWIAAHQNEEYVFIRRADSSDLHILTPLTVKLYGCDHTYDDLAEENTALLTSDNDAVFIAFDGDKAIGFSHISLRHEYVEGTESGVKGYLEGVYTDENYRNRGIACSLVSAGEQWAKSKGCKEFASDCNLENTNSLLFHLKIGFEEVGRIICFKKDLEDEK